MNDFHNGLPPDLRKGIREAAAAGLNHRRQARRVLILSLITVAAVIAGGLWMSRSQTDENANLLDSGQAAVLCLRSAPFEGALIDVMPLTVRTLNAEESRKLMDEDGMIVIGSQDDKTALEQAMTREDRTLYVVSRYAFSPGTWVEPWSLTKQGDGLTMTLAEDTAIASDGVDDGSAYSQKSYFFYILAAVKNQGTGEVPMDVRMEDANELTAADQAEFHVRRLLTSPAGWMASSYGTLINVQPAVWDRILALPDDAFTYMLAEAWSRRDDPSARTQIMTLACMERVTGVPWRDTSQSPVLWLQENYDTLMELGIPRPVGRLLLNEKRRELLAGFDRTDRDQAIRAVLMENLTIEGYPVAVWDLIGERTLGEQRVALSLWAGAYGCGVETATGYQGPIVMVLERSGPAEPWYCLDLTCSSLDDGDFDGVFGEFAGDARDLAAAGVESRHNEALRQQIQAAIDEGLPLCRPEHMAGEGPVT